MGARKLTPMKERGGFNQEKGGGRMDYHIAPVNQEELVRLRRELHMYPELRWDLDRTSALVRRARDAGILS